MPAFDIGFAGNRLDRLPNAREDAAKVAELAGDVQARAVVFVQDMPVLHLASDRLEALHPLEQARKFAPPAAEVLLGRDGAGPIFALLLPDEAARLENPDPAEQGRLVVPDRSDLQIRDLRAVAAKTLVGREDLAILAQAKAILHFHATHAHCARCGAPTKSAHAGWRRDCSACGALHFPRTDPVAIMLVVDGDSCLLGRQRHFPEKMYSCLAGYVEAGETLEEAVRREVLEEAGIEVGAVTYLASQPWPFPSTLMLGCMAQAFSRGIVMDAVELEDCRWFSRAEARAMIEGAHRQGFFAPSQFAIARTLLEFWLEGA